MNGFGLAQCICGTNAKLAKCYTGRERMRMTKELFDFVFCCLSQEQQNQIEIAIKNNMPAPIYHAQENLVKEKSGYRCKKCGKLYSFLQLDYKHTLMNPQKYSKPAGNLYKGKKAAVVFCDRYYYAQNKKTLLKFEVDTEHNVRQTDTIPIMGDVYHTIVSQDEKYIATETFQGTIEVIDTYTKLPVAKKQKTPINGAFIFTYDHKLLYFFEDAIRCWDFINNEDMIVRSIPEQQKLHFGYPKIVCDNILYDSRTQTHLFQFNGRGDTYVVVQKDMGVERELQLPAAPTLSKLVYSEEQNQYTLTEKSHVVIYDSDFDVVERFASPRMICIHDGGGMFPVTRHVSEHPNRTFLSPDGKWLLLDYFNSIILMRREDKEICFCLYSYTGKAAQNMGFTDCSRFWYTWGDTTYIQQIEA